MFLLKDQNKTKQNKKNEPSWERPYLMLLTTETAVCTAEEEWTHHIRIKKTSSSLELWVTVLRLSPTKLKLKKVSFKYIFYIVFSF